MINYDKILMVNTQFNNNKNYPYSDNDLYLSEAIEKISTLVMLNQVFEAKEICMQAIEEMKRNREFEDRMTNLLERDK